MKKATTFRFEQELLAELKKKAKEENRSVTNLIETILWNWLRTH